ncbi:ankyrin repeat-containing domain protein [Cladorrhinum sp. PSN259]|nr:ankyrin repeat-containing domain protein [Cladorrhinum sp. PSN259]
MADSEPKKSMKSWGTPLSEIDKQNVEDKTLAKKALAYILAAKRPLTIDELLHSLSVCPGHAELSEYRIPDIQHLLRISSGLIEIDPNTSIARLADASLHRYLNTYREILLPHSESAFARTCVTYLSFDEFKNGPCRSWNGTIQRVQKYPFLLYSASHWGDHFAKCQEDEEVFKLVRAFLVDHGRVASSLQVMHLPPIAREDPTAFQNYPWHDRFPKQVSPLHMVAYFDLSSVVYTLLSHDASRLLNMQNSDGRTAVMTAAAKGHILVVQMLLYYQASKMLKDNEGWTALHLAVINGHTEVTEALVKRPAIDASELNEALKLAAQRGSEQIVELLVYAGADINWKNDAGNTAVMFAVPRGHQEVVRVLIEQGADVDAKDSQGNGLLHWAIRYPETVRLLSDKGANVQARNHQGKTPLHWAAQEGQTETVQILLQSGSEINAKDKHGFTPLHSAALKGHHYTAKLLLENGANPSETDNNGWIPLHAALLNHHSSTITLLSQSLPNPQETITDFATLLSQPHTKPILASLASQKSPSNTPLSTPLLLAINSTHHSLLLSSLANLSSASEINSPDPVGTYTPLTLSCSLGLYQISETLLQNSASPNIPDKTGTYPIHYAALNGDTALIELLLSFDADAGATIPGSNSATALLLASQQWYPLTVDALIRQQAQGADILNVPDQYGRTMLHYAAEQESGKALLRYAVTEKGADVDAQDLWGRTPLFYAVEAAAERTGVVSLLVRELGADVSVKASDGTTALHVAAFVSDDKEVANQLVKCDFASAKGGLTALHVAALRGHREVASLLLEKGADREAEWRVGDDGDDGDDDMLRSPLLGIGEVLISRKVGELVARVYGNSGRKAFTVRELAAIGGVVDVLDIPIPEPGVWDLGRLLSSLGW